LNLRLDPELAEGLAIGPVVLAVVVITRRTRGRARKRDLSGEAHLMRQPKQPV